MLSGKDSDFYHENSIEAFKEIGNTPSLLGFVLLYLSSIAFYNLFGLSVAKYAIVHFPLHCCCVLIICAMYKIFVVRSSDPY